MSLYEQTLLGTVACFNRQNKTLFLNARPTPSSSLCPSDTFSCHVKPKSVHVIGFNTHLQETFFKAW